MEIMTNEENEWDHRISAAAKGPAHCIRIDDVATALTKMKRHKAPNDTSHRGYWNSADIGFM